MSEEDKDSKTEQASERRLQRAFEEGDIALGRDFAMVGAFAAGGVALVFAARPLCDAMVKMVQVSLNRLHSPHLGELTPFLGKPAGIVIAACAAAMVATVAVLAFQTKGGLWPNLAMPDMQKVFGSGRLKRLIEKDVFIDLGLAFVKTLTIGVALWDVLKDEFLTLPRLLYVGPDVQLRATFGPLAGGMVRILTALVFVAGLDLAVTKWRYRKRMMMTKEEAKREYREEEGDPMFRSRRRRKHRDIIKGQIAIEVPRADVLVVNPTHIAIALRYRPEEDKAPRVTAKGKGQIAENMRDLARQHGVVIVEDIPLARLLYKRVKVGKFVPMETYKAVAAVLAFVYRVLGRSPAASGAVVR